MTGVVFESFASIPRLARECVITEKLDGTNGVVYVGEDGLVLAGSRSRWVTPEDDNYGFARWVKANEDELRVKLGIGRHHGEWYGAGVQKRYGLKGNDKRFALFNTSTWADAAVRPACCEVVPILYQGPFDTNVVEKCLEDLRVNGSRAVPGCMTPEGVVVYHVAARTYFKRTLDGDGHKGAKQGAN